MIDRHEDRWLRSGYPKVHTCKLPGWWKRRTAKAQNGALWRCGICKQVWLWGITEIDLQVCGIMWDYWHRVEV